MRMVRFKELPSTHTLCQKLLPLVSASEDQRQDICIVADKQTQGITSKAGYSWKHESDASLATSLGLSVRLSSQKLLQATPFMQFVAGYCVVKGLQELFQIEHLALKWPNDIYYRQLKCGGILTSLVPVPQRDATSSLHSKTLEHYLEGATEDRIIKTENQAKSGHQTGRRQLGSSNLDYILLIGVGVNIRPSQSGSSSVNDGLHVTSDVMNQPISYLASSVDKIRLTQYIHMMLGQELDLLESEFTLPAHWMGTVKQKYEPLMLWKGQKVHLMAPQEVGLANTPAATGILQGLNEYGGVNVLQESGEIFKTFTKMTMRQATL